MCLKGDDPPPGERPRSEDRCSLKRTESAIFAGMPVLPHDLQILSATAGEYPHLLHWILSADSGPASEDPLVWELLDRHRRGLVSLDLLLQAVSMGKTVGTAWGQVLPGRIGIIWPLRLAAGIAPQAGVELLQTIDNSFDRQGVLLPVSVIDTETTDAMALHRNLLEMVGYEPQTRLQIMSKAIASPLQQPAGPLHFLSDVDHPFLAGILEQTEVESGDIPEIQGIRSGSDILATFEQEAEDSLRAWYVVRHEGNPVGCLLLASNLLTESCSIQYMGLLPGFRARGWGRLLVDHAENWGRRQNARRLRLMVDSRNQRATRLYNKCGLQIDHQQQFWMRGADVRGT